MPLYEYRCETCAHSFEILQGLGGSAEGLACPSCGSDRLQKQFSTFASAGGDSAMDAGASMGGCCRGTPT